MIRHIVLFKFRPGISWDDPRAQEAELIAAKVGGEVPELHEWSAGRNISGRAIAYDFAVIGLLDDEDALERYLVHPFHQEAIRLWREISEWVIADLEE
ncbi:Dabb family protein [Streptomyces kunmingensis]|uniref:Dabb family protein n=1 Tax=Streptomyces kunmingensis TaxID=68225 RepID=A0ABU6CN75_9ACTN|nr:Dabb family protein [Streptomyces kunmingensis]MEB3966179.1 Dabb family protein [Streptomyces kunmingensis]